MKIFSKEELDIILTSCKAKPCSEIKDGGSFYKIKAQSFQFPNGKVQVREYIDKKKASVVVPITTDGDLVLVVQPIALSEEGSLVEFPAGYWELGEASIETGIRELSEETGYEPEEIIYIGSHYQDPGSIRQKVDVYLALGCQKANRPKLDKGEYIKQVEIPFDLAIELMEDGYLQDANSFIALTKAEKVLKKRYYETGTKKI